MPRIRKIVIATFAAGVLAAGIGVPIVAASGGNVTASTHFWGAAPGR